MVLIFVLGENLLNHVNVNEWIWNLHFGVLRLYSCKYWEYKRYLNDYKLYWSLLTIRHHGDRCRILNIVVVLLELFFRFFGFSLQRLIGMTETPLSSFLVFHPPLPPCPLVKEQHQWELWIKSWKTRNPAVDLVVLMDSNRCPSLWTEPLLWEKTPATFSWI